MQKSSSKKHSIQERISKVIEDSESGCIKCPKMHTEIASTLESCHISKTAPVNQRLRTEVVGVVESHGQKFLRVNVFFDRTTHRLSKMIR